MGTRKSDPASASSLGATPSAPYNDLRTQILCKNAVENRQGRFLTGDVSGSAGASSRT